MRPDLEVNLEMSCLGAPSVLNSWSPRRPGTLSNIRTFKGSPLLARHCLTSGTTHQWNQSKKRSLTVLASLWTMAAGVHLSLQSSGLSSLQTTPVLILNQTAFAQHGSWPIASFCLKPFCSLLSLTNKGPLGHLEWDAFTCI